MNTIPKITTGAILIAFIAIFGLSCKDDVTDTNNIVFPDSNISYGQTVDPLFQSSCAFSGCHDSQTRAGNYSMESWYDVVGSDPGVVLAGDTVNSRLVWRIEGKNNLVRMPLDRPPLNTNQINGLKKWIKEGAKNN